MARSLVARALTALLLAAPVSGTNADYTCKLLDPPGSTFTSFWQINNVGDVVANASLGSFIYSGGAWLPLPAPPVASGLTLDNVGATGINDTGVLAGSTYSSSGPSETGFIISGGHYSFFKYPQGALLRAFTEPRAINDNGIVTGIAYNLDATGSMIDSVGFVYNPTGAAGYAPGFTEFVPERNGQVSARTMLGQMNAANQFVGSANFPGEGTYGFLYDPATTSYSYFQLNSRYTNARGINDLGYVAGFTYSDVTNLLTGFVLTGQGTQLITCPNLPMPSSVVAESINNLGVVAGGWTGPDGISHGFLAYPSVVVEEMADLVSAVMDVGPGKSLTAKLRSAANALAVGDVAATCTVLATLESEMSAQISKQIAASQANALIAKVQALAVALKCP